MDLGVGFPSQDLKKVENTLKGRSRAYDVSNSTKVLLILSTLLDCYRIFLQIQIPHDYSQSF